MLTSMNSLTEKNDAQKGPALVIVIESGVVSDIYSSAPVQAVIVDYDMIEDDDPFERRMRKAVLPFGHGRRVGPGEVALLVASLARSFVRLGRGRGKTSSAFDGEAA